MPSLSLRESCKNASVLARECSFLTLLVYDGARKSRILLAAASDQGAALDLRFFGFPLEESEGNSSKTLSVLATN